MGLPASREITAGGATPIPSSAFNVIQDLLIRWFGVQQTIRIPVAGYGSPDSNGDVWQWDHGGVTGTPLPPYHIPIVLPDGSKIVNVRARVKDSAVGPTKLAFLTDKSIDTAETALGGGGTISAGTGAWQTLARNGLNEVTVAGTIYYATINTNVGADAGHVQWIEVDFIPAP